MTFKELYNLVNSSQGFIHNKLLLIPEQEKEIQNNNLKIENASKFEIKQILDTFFKCFPQYNTEEIKQYVLHTTNFNKSFVLTDGKEVYGIYLLGDRQLHQIIKDEELTPTENLDNYKNKVGIELVAIGIVPEKRKLGYASLLKSKSRQPGYDYSCNLEFKELGNIEHWLKNQRIVAQNDEMYLTLQDF